MSRGKYSAAQQKRRHKKKNSMLIPSLVVLILGVVGGSMALLADSTKPVTNTFIPAVVEVDPTETVTHNTKSDIAVKNPKNDSAVPVYIRATISVYWTDHFAADNNSAVAEHIIPQPAGATITIPSVPNNGWILGDDGYYYYSDVVDPGETTKPLFATAIQVNIPDETLPNVKCHVDIHTEAIQADGLGATSAQDAWVKARGA